MGYKKVSVSEFMAKALYPVKRYKLIYFMYSKLGHFLLLSHTLITLAITHYYCIPGILHNYL